MTSIGKRSSTSDPLTADDVAERLSRAAFRLIQIMMDIRQQEGDLYEDVRKSRYLTAGILQGVQRELNEWGQSTSDQS